MKEKVYKVLIVEDYPLSRELMIKFVKSLPDLSVAGIAKNGDEALNKLQTSQFDLVMMDIDLPIISGIEVLKKITSRPYIIFTTGSKEHSLKAYELDAVDYLLKPLSFNKFNRAIERFRALYSGDQNLIEKNFILRNIFHTDTKVVSLIF